MVIASEVVSEKVIFEPTPKGQEGQPCESGDRTFQAKESTECLAPSYGWNILDQKVDPVTPAEGDKRTNMQDQIL